MQMAFELDAKFPESRYIHFMFEMCVMKWRMLHDRLPILCWCVKESKLGEHCMKSISTLNSLCSSFYALIIIGTGWYNNWKTFLVFMCNYTKRYCYEFERWCTIQFVHNTHNDYGKMCAILNLGLIGNRCIQKNHFQHWNCVYAFE